MWFPALATADGEKSVFLDLGPDSGPLTMYMSRFRHECKKAGKKLMVWTVNDPAQMMEVSQPARTRASLGALRRVL